MSNEITVLSRRRFILGASLGSASCAIRPTLSPTKHDNHGHTRYEDLAGDSVFSKAWQSTTETPSQTLRVLAWNTYLLPTIAPYVVRRARVMPGVLGGYDLLALSEMFADTERSEILSSLRGVYPWQLEGPQRDGKKAVAFLNGGKVTQRLRDNGLIHDDDWLDGLNQDGGLVVMSRYPIVDANVKIYRATAGSDAWADKGILYAKVRFPLEGSQRLYGYLNVFATHTQAHKDGHLVRSGQTAEILDFISLHDDGHPCLLLGDLNVIGESTEYWRFVNRIRPFRDCFRTVHDGAPGYTYDAARNFLPNEDVRERLDYVLVKNSGAFQQLDVGSAKVADELAREYPVTPEHDAARRALNSAFQLSDHFGVEAVLKLTPLELIPRRWSVDPMLATELGVYWPMRALYEYARYVVVGFHRVSYGEPSDIVFRYSADADGDFGDILHKVVVQESGAEIREAVIAARGWNLSPESPNSFPRACVHLAGHLLGLIDDDDPDSVMASFETPSTTLTLNARDVLQLSRLYTARKDPRPPAPSTQAELEGAVELLLRDLEGDVLYGVKYAGPTKARLRVSALAYYWSGSDDWGIVEDDEVRFLSAVAVSGTTVVPSAPLIVPDNSGFEMPQDKPTWVHFVTDFVQGDDNARVEFDELELGVTITVRTHAWEVDGPPYFTNGPDDDYGEAQATITLRLEDAVHNVIIGNGPWKASWLIALAGVQDAANQYRAERERRRRELEIRAELKTLMLPACRALLAAQESFVVMGNASPSSLRDSLHGVLGPFLAQRGARLATAKSLDAGVTRVFRLTHAAPSNEELRRINELVFELSLAQADDQLQCLELDRGTEVALLHESLSRIARASKGGVCKEITRLVAADPGLLWTGMSENDLQRAFAGYCAQVYGQASRFARGAIRTRVAISASGRAFPEIVLPKEAEDAVVLALQAIRQNQRDLAGTRRDGVRLMKHADGSADLQVQVSGDGEEFILTVGRFVSQGGTGARSDEGTSPR